MKNDRGKFSGKLNILPFKLQKLATTKATIHSQKASRFQIWGENGKKPYELILSKGPSRFFTNSAQVYDQVRTADFRNETMLRAHPRNSPMP
jgi:hypothetical protein